MLIYCRPFNPFSLDGTRVVTASDDNTARVWDATTGKLLLPPLTHQGTVHSAVFRADGARIVTASWDRTARVWDAVTGRPLSPPIEHPDSVNSAVFNPDGTRILTMGDDEIARIWEIAFDGGTFAEWSAIAERSPYEIINGVLSPRASQRSSSRNG
jgi:WD40 repeat protein